jgi:hypothetical protein
MSRFDRWRINYDLLIRILQAKENQLDNKNSERPIDGYRQSGKKSKKS